MKLRSMRGLALAAVVFAALLLPGTVQAQQLTGTVEVGGSNDDASLVINLRRHLRVRD